MSKLSKYYRVTNQILIEYVADQDPLKSDLSATTYYIYTGLDNKTYYTEEIHNKSNLYSNQAIYLRIPDQSDSEYMFIGVNKNGANMRPETLSMASVLAALKKNKQILSYTTGQKTQMVYDKIKVHLIYGFTLDKLTGFNLQLSVLCNTLRPKQSTSGNLKLYDRFDNPIFDTIEVVSYNKSDLSDNTKIKVEPLSNVTDNLILLDLYFPKELLQKAVKWHKSAIYQNGSFYDRYIEIDVPSAFYISLNSVVKLQAQNPLGYMPLNSELQSIPYLTPVNNTYNNRVYNLPGLSAGTVGATPKYALIPDNPNQRFVSYTVPENPEIIVGFSTTSEGSVSAVNDDKVFYKQYYFQDPIDLISLKYKSNSDYFNVRILEDTLNNEILYYPVYGDGDSVQDLDINVMNEIETGAIPMLSNGFYNTEDNMEEFYEMYGEGARQWIIYNDMSVTYNYSNIIKHLDDTLTVDLVNTERFTNIIDYTNKSIEDGQFWRSKFIPRVNTYNNYRINSICIMYTCRLVNRLTSIECIRTATLLIEHPERYVTKRIAINNVNTYKVINKIQQHEIVTTAILKNFLDKYIRSFYDTTNIVISNMGNGAVYNLGQMDLKLKRSSTNYMFRLYVLNEDNIRVPFDLTGPYKYKLMFPTNDGEKIYIAPNTNSSELNLGVGQIIFYITEEQVRRIMSVPVNERYFAIVTDVNNKALNQSTLYEGTVSYY